ncbi:MAG: DMT family transporter [Hyphomicrobiales bacterium]
MPSPATLRHPTLADLLKITLLGTIWGSAFLAIKLSVHETGPLWLVMIRVAIAFVPIALFAWWRKDPLPPTPGDWTVIIAMSLLNTVGPFFLISWAELHIPAGVTSLIMGVGPLATMVAAHFTTPDDRFTGGKILGMVLGFAGLALVVAPELAQGIGFDAVAYAAVWTGMLCYVAAGTLIRFVRGTSVPMMTAVNMGVGVIALTPLVLLAHDPLPHLTGTAMLAALYLGLVCTGLAYLLRASITVTVGQSFMSMASYFMPVSGVLLAWAVLGEPITWHIVAALACVVSGFAVSRRRPVRATSGGTARRRSPRRPAPRKG